MIYNLPKVTVKEYYSLEESEFIKYEKLYSMLLINDDLFLKHKAETLTKLSYGQVSTLKRAIMNPTFDEIMECMEIVYNIKQTKVLSADIVSYFYALKWIYQEVFKIIEREAKVLQSEPDAKMELAGIQRLNVLKELPGVIHLAKSFGKSPEEIYEWKYNLVFSILLHNKIYGEVEKAYQELLTR